ncbi:MFS transporter OS=Streptomyces cyaneofuscatus OX=66883 GN=G3I52_27885 PE=4 SV=1 [Streptomyces cyaneofuscatus]
MQSVAGLLLTIYAVKHLAAEGWSTAVAAVGVAGLAVLVWFVRRQLTLEHPLIDFRLFRDRVFTVAIITGLLPLAAWSATAYLSGVYLQSVLGIPSCAPRCSPSPGPCCSPSRAS